VGQPLSIEEVQLDSPGPREVLVRTACAGLCHSDLSIMNGYLGGFAEVPAVLGHESAGVVEAVGSQVSYVQPGDHVITCLSQFCGICEFCLSGRPYLCTAEAIQRGPNEPPRITQDGAKVGQMAALGSFAEQLLVHENAIVKIDQDIPMDVAALVGCGVTTGLGAALNTAQVRGASTTAVIGCGGVGLAAIQGCDISGARMVIAVDMVESRLERARALGATHTVNASNGDAVEQVRELTGGGVDYAFEVVGSRPTAEQAFQMTKSGGMAVIVGVVIGQEITVPGTMLQYDRTLRGCMMGSNRFRVDMPRWLDLYKQGKLRLDEFITARISLDEINDGYDAMTRGEGARSVIMFDDA
jgi:S-(hydroxymethyl)glutathione dehydrogenase/alcohol dehydrogenase